MIISRNLCRQSQLGHLHHDNCKPKRRTETLHHHVRWNLSKHIKWEENGKRIVVLQRSWIDLQVPLKAKESGISDVGSIKEGQPRSILGQRRSNRHGEHTDIREPRMEPSANPTSTTVSSSFFHRNGIHSRMQEDCVSLPQRAQCPSSASPP